MDKYVMRRAALMITFRCSLKCKLCGAFVPYCNSPQHFSLDLIKKTINKQFELADYIDKYTLTGGEPLMHEKLPSILLYIMKYKEKIGVLEIITNSTIVPNKELMSAFLACRDKLDILIDDYGLASSKSGEIDKLLTENDITHRVRIYHGSDAHCGGWVDYGGYKQLLFSQSDIENRFRQCTFPKKIGFCYTAVNGQMHPCAYSRHAMELGIIPDNENEYLDLFDDSMSIEEKRMHLKAIDQLKSLTACAYCNGICEDSKRYNPGEQLSQEELGCVKQGAKSYYDVCAMLGKPMK